MQDSLAHSPAWIFLLGIFWQGFSLTSISTLVVLWALPYFRNYDRKGNRKTDDPKLHRPPLERLAVSVPVLSGVFGVVFSMNALAAFVVQKGISQNIYFGIFVCAAMLGVMFALLLRRRL